MTDIFAHLKYLCGQRNVFKKDIQWWISFMHVYNGVSMIKTCDWSKVDQVFMTDSCLTGCGGICGDQFFHRQFPEFVTEAYKIFKSS